MPQKIRRLLPLMFSVWAGLCVAVPYGPYANTKPSELKHIEDYLVQKIKSNPLTAEEKGELGFVYLAQNRLVEAEKIGFALRDEGKAEEWMPLLGAIWYLQEDFDAILDHLVVDREDIQHALWAQEVLVLRAEALMAYGHTEEALAILQALKQVNSHSSRLWEALAKVHIRLLAFEKATEELKEAHRVGGRLADIAVVQGDMYRLKGDMEASRSSYERALRANPQHLEARLRLTGLQMNAKEMDQFQKNLAILWQQLPNNPEVQLFKAADWMSQNQLSTARKLLLSLVERKPHFEAASLLLARLSLTEKRYEEAERLVLPQVLRTEPSPEARNLLAAIYMKSAKPQKAIQLLEPYVSEQTEEKHVIELLGTAYLLNEEWDKGMLYLEKASKLATFSKKTSKIETALSDWTKIANDFKTEAEVLETLSALQRGDWLSAEKTALAYMKTEGETALSHYLLGLVYEAKGSRDSAIQQYQIAMEFDPRFLQAQQQLAKLYAKEGNTQEANQVLNKVLLKSPNNLAVLLQKASLEEAEGEFAQALTHLQQAMNLYPNQPEPGQAIVVLYSRMKQPEKALDLCRSLYQQFPEDISVARLYGQLALESGRDKEAEMVFLHLLQKQPASPLVLQNLARAEKNLGKWNAAEDHLQQALTLDSQYLPALLLKGDLALLKEDFEEAIVLAKALINALPSTSAGYELLAEAYHHQGRAKEASGAYEKAFEYEASAKLAKSLYFSRLSEGRQQEAFEPLEKWLSNNPDDVASARFLANEYLLKGFPLKAIGAYEQLLQYANQDILALNNLALLILEKDPKRSLDLAIKANDLSANQPKILDTYALALAKNGKTQEAIQTFQKAMQLSPNDPEIAAHYTEVYRQK